MQKCSGPLPFYLNGGTIASPRCSPLRQRLVDEFHVEAPEDVVLGMVGLYVAEERPPSGAPKEFGRTVEAICLGVFQARFAGTYLTTGRNSIHAIHSH